MLTIHSTIHGTIHVYKVYHKKSTKLTQRTETYKEK